jgi:hypothetical protein
MVILMEIADQLQYDNTFLPPSIRDILRLSWVNHREKVRARNNFANFNITSIEVLISIVNSLDVRTRLFFFFLFNFVSVQFLLTLKTVFIKES